MATPILADTSKYYKQNLELPNFYQYVTKTRKYNCDTIHTFGIGASPNNYGLIKHLSQFGYSRENMLEYGLIAKQNNEFVDCMNKRFTMEIRDWNGELCGFCGRVLTDTKRYKYLNTKTTPYFAKRKVVFNLDKAKYYIPYTSDPYLIVVEGYCDVMSLWQNGIRNVVALMGTACTEYHAKLINMFCPKVVLCLDGDKAGQEATLRADTVLQENGIVTRKLYLPQNQDADEIMQTKNGQSLFKNLVQTALYH